jgi:hypothetical protein
MIKDDRVKLTIAAAERFPDLGTRLGTVAYVANSWAGVDWDGKPERTLLPIRSLEALGTVWTGQGMREPPEPSPSVAPVQAPP